MVKFKYEKRNSMERKDFELERKITTVLLHVCTSLAWYSTRYLYVSAIFCVDTACAIGLNTSFSFK